MVVVAVCQRLRVPSVVGFLISGALLGPGVVGLVEDQHAIEVLAEIGVVLLLFSIGLEFSLAEFTRMRTLVLGTGGAQVSLTIAVIAGLALALGLPVNEAVFIGFLVALSSTALVLTMLGERGESATVHGRIALGILIFQDLAIVPLVLLTPLLGGTDATLLDAASQLGLAAFVIVATLVGASRVFPRVLDLVALTESRELFTIFTVTVALGTAWLTGLAGLSLALGAFLAGLVVSESDYGARVHSEVLPFKDVLNSVFFISIGMLVDPSVWLADPLMVIGGVGAVLLLKGALVGAVVFAFGFGARIAVLVGLSLAQIGEFSFVLAHLGETHGLLSADAYQTMISVSVATMMVTPVMMSLAAPLAERAGQVAWLDRFVRKGRLVAPQAEELRDHVVICGYGLNGTNVARVLARLDVPYVVVELNPQLVSIGADKGEPVVYGDATRRPMLEHVAVGRARAVVITVADRLAGRTICALARQMNPTAEIVVRTRYVADVEELHELGANEVVPEEFETALELVGRVMASYGASESAVFLEKTLIRRERYGLLLGEPPAHHHPTLQQLLGSAHVQSVVVEEGSEADGATVASLALPERFGVLVLVIERDGRPTVSPPPDQVIGVGERVFVFGPTLAVEPAIATFRAAA